MPRFFINKGEKMSNTINIKIYNLINQYKDELKLIKNPDALSEKELEDVDYNESQQTAISCITGFIAELESLLKWGI
jgi:hypothetical protein